MEPPVEFGIINAMRDIRMAINVFYKHQVTGHNVPSVITEPNIEHQDGITNDKLLMKILTGDVGSCLGSLSCQRLGLVSHLQHQQTSNISDLFFPTEKNFESTMRINLSSLYH